MSSRISRWWRHAASVRHRRRLTGVAFLVVASMLTACNTLKQTSPAVESSPPSADQLRLWNKHLASLSTVSHWYLKGRMAVTTSQRADTANVIWERGTIRDKLDIYGPFGSGHVRISADPSGASLINASQTVNTAATIRDLLYEEAGWPVPFDALKYWLIGAPLPATKAEWQLDIQGRLQWLRQSGWMIRFSDYGSHGGFDLPRKLRLEALPGTASLTFPDGKVSDQLVVKFVINKISPNPGLTDDNISSSGEN